MIYYLAHFGSVLEMQSHSRASAVHQPWQKKIYILTKYPGSLYTYEEFSKDLNNWFLINLSRPTILGSTWWENLI